MLIKLIQKNGKIKSIFGKKPIKLSILIPFYFIPPLPQYVAVVPLLSHPVG